MSEQTTAPHNQGSVPLGIHNQVDRSISETERRRIHDALTLQSDNPWHGQDVMREDFDTKVSLQLVDQLPDAWKVDPNAYIRTFDKEQDGARASYQQIVFPNYYVQSLPDNNHGEYRLVFDENGILQRDESHDLPVIKDTGVAKMVATGAGIAALGLTTIMAGHSLLPRITESLDDVNPFKIIAEDTYISPYSGKFEDMCYEDEDSLPKDATVYNGAGQTVDLEGLSGIVVVNGATTTVRVGEVSLHALVVCGANTTSLIGDEARIDTVEAYGSGATVRVDVDASVMDANAFGGNALVER